MRKWWPGAGDLRLMGMRATSHRAEPQRLSHPSTWHASPSRQNAEQEVNVYSPAMPDLLLHRASGRRPSAQWPDDYDVIGADGQVIGRIFRAVAAPVGTPWAWTIVPEHRKGWALTEGHTETQQQAKWAFSRSWRRGLDAAT